MAAKDFAAAPSADKFSETLDRVIRSLNAGAAKADVSPRLFFPHGINEIVLRFKLPSEFEVSIKGPATSGKALELELGAEEPFDTLRVDD